jgi:ribosomal protein L23
MNRQGKAAAPALGIGKRKDTKRAIVTLARGHDRHLRQREPER